MQVILSPSSAALGPHLQGLTNILWIFSQVLQEALAKSDLPHGEDAGMEAGNTGVEPSAAQPDLRSFGVQVTRKTGVHTVGTQTNDQKVLQSDRHVVMRSHKSSEADESDLPPLDAHAVIAFFLCA